MNELEQKLQSLEAELQAAQARMAELLGKAAAAPTPEQMQRLDHILASLKALGVPVS